MSKKRTSLDTLFASTPTRTQPPAAPVQPDEKATSGKRPGIKQQTVYLPLPVHDQLRRLAFEEHARMHDLLLEGLGRVFRDRGLPAIDELTQPGGGVVQRE